MTCGESLAELALEQCYAAHPPNRGRRWTEEHDLRVARDYGVVGVKALARELGRTQRAVYARAHRLGVACGSGGRQRRWTEEEDRIVARTVAKLAEVLGCRPGQAGSRCNFVADRHRGVGPGKTRVR